MTQIADEATTVAVLARRRLGPAVLPQRPHSPSVPLRGTLPASQIRCHVISRAELQRYPLWRSTFAALRKDHRYYEILEDTINDRFSYRYFVITTAAGEALAIQPFFLMDQDMLEGVAAFQPMVARVRRVLPGFLMVRTLMIGCAAGEGHLAESPRIAAADIVKVIATKAREYARSVDAELVVIKELPAHYRDACDRLLRDGFCRVPSMPMVVLDLTHGSFDDFMQKTLRANARRHLKKNLAATEAQKIELQVTRNAAPLAEEMHRLYLQVFEKSAFRFEKLTPEFFRRLGEDMGDKVRFFAWRLDARLIACSMSMIEGDRLYLEYIGLDYSVAHVLHLYHYTFRDQYNWAAQNGCTKICSSGLGYDPKLHLRFRLAPIDLYVQHVHPLTNFVLQRVLKFMVPARYDAALKKFPNYGDLWA
jgi:hypothetical protein